MATAAAPTQTKALARFEDVRAAMAEYTPDRYISLIPTVDMERSPLYRPATMVVPIDPADVRDVYKSPANDGTVCLRARKLEQIGSAIGVKWHDVKIEHNEKRATVTATVHAEYTDAVGDRIPLVAAATEYLTPAKGRSVSTYPDEKAQARARAILVKKLTGLPTSFDPKELAAKQFAGLRWVLDDRQPDIREAIINRGMQAAAQVYGREAPQKAIDAGRAEPEEHPGEVVDTSAREAVDDAEPEIPAEAVEAATTQADIDAIAGAAAAAVAKRAEAERSTLVDDELLAIVGTKLRDALGLEPRVTRSRWPIVRVAILRGLFPAVTKSKLATVAQARVVIDLATKKAPELETLFSWALAHDPTLADVAAEIAKPEQQTLAGGAA